MLLNHLIAACLLVGPSDQGIGADLAAAVDLPTSKERQQAALALSKRADVSLDDWLQAARTFGEFVEHEAGIHVAAVDLQVGDKIEHTQIHYWVPESYDPKKPTPTLLALHGAGGIGLSEVQTWQNVASDLNMLIVAPTDAGANQGYSFDEREQLAALATLRWLRRKFNVDENRIHLTGVSRGGHLCWELALRHPQHWASLAPRIGGPALAIVGGRNTIRFAANIAHIPLRLLQGMQDDAKMIVNQRMLFTRLEEVGAVDAEFVAFETLGHSYDLAAVNFVEFFGKAKRNPLLDRFTLRTLSPEHGQMYSLQIDKLDKKAVVEFQPRVDPNLWNNWGHQQKAEFIQIEADKRTGEADAIMTSPGHIQLKSKLVRKMRLLLPSEMLDEKGRIEIQYQGKTQSKKPKRDRKVLLSHFVEHFDRSFLPVCEIKLN